MKALFFFSTLFSFVLLLLERYDEAFPPRVASLPDLKTQRANIYCAAYNTKWTKTTPRKKK
jgi:hypothetical protein